MRTNKLICLAVILLAGMMNAKSQEWTQFLGPDRNSNSGQKGLLRKWPANGPEVLWTVRLGIGFGGPVIKDGKVYILDREDKVSDNLRCFDLATGKELWSFVYDAPGTAMFPGSRSVPALDGNYIYSCGHNGDLYCLNLTTRKPVWNRNVWKDFGGGELPRWAITQNPLVHGDLVIVASQAPRAGVVAYEKLTGNVKWTTPPIGPVGYVSPSILKVGNESHVVMISAASGRGESATGGKVAGIDPLTGRILWEYSGWQCVIPVPSPYDAGENRLLITGGYNAGSAMIKIGKNKDGSYTVTELFKTSDFGDHTKPPVYINGYFYAQHSTNERRDGLVCMSTDGKIMWKTMRNPFFDKGSMIVADGLILATDGRKTLFLIEPDPAGFKPLASAELLVEGIPGSSEGSTETRSGGATQNWGPIALGEGKLLLRDQGKLICVKVIK